VSTPATSRSTTIRRSAAPDQSVLLAAAARQRKRMRRAAGVRCCHCTTDPAHRRDLHGRPVERRSPRPGVGRAPAAAPNWRCGAKPDDNHERFEALDMLRRGLQSESSPTTASSWTWPTCGWNCGRSGRTTAVVGGQPESAAQRAPAHRQPIAQVATVTDLPRAWNAPAPRTAEIYRPEQPLCAARATLHRPRRGGARARHRCVPLLPLPLREARTGGWDATKGAASNERCASPNGSKQQGEVPGARVPAPC
jgi:hypothetical protein